MKKPNIKKLILNQLSDSLNSKIDILKKSIDSTKESRDSETKSSVGDKYETGRAMAQMELEKNQAQLNNIIHQKNELLKIDANKQFTQAEFGALIITDKGNYFLSFGFGKIEIGKDNWFCISPSSPIGQQLLQKSAGNSFQFQGREFEIKQII